MDLVRKRRPTIAGNRHSHEQIINKPRQAKVEIANAATVAQVCKKICVIDQPSGGATSVAACVWKGLTMSAAAARDRGP